MLTCLNMENQGNIDGLTERIQMAMEVRGMSQADLARATGMSTAQINHLVTGRTKDPQFRTILLVAKALDVRLDYLAGYK